MHQDHRVVGDPSPNPSSLWAFLHSKPWTGTGGQGPGPSNTFLRCPGQGQGMDSHSPCWAGSRHCNAFPSKSDHRPTSADANMSRNFHHHLQSVSPPLCMHEERFYVCLFIFPPLSPHCHHSKGASSNEINKNMVTFKIKDEGLPWWSSG